MVAMIVGVGWMILKGKLKFSPIRLGLYCVFVALCLISQVLVGSIGSFPSIIELFLLTGYMTLSVELPENAYLQMLNRFSKLMLIPALIMLCQYGVQKITGQRDPISMDQWVGSPETSQILYHGYFYEAAYPLWTSSFTRPNGFFFLEPSFASMFTATAGIIEVMYFRRTFFLVLMMSATVLSFGGTGMTMFLVAAPFLLTRQNPRFIIGCLVVAVMGLGTAYALNIPVPLIDRLGELQTTQSSGASRVTVPANQLVTLMFDHTHIVGGTGAGATSDDATTFGNAWPILKLINEYGLLAMLSFIALYATSLSGNDRNNVALKVALTIIYQFTGGYLLSPVMLELVVFLCCFIKPIPAMVDDPSNLVILNTRPKTNRLLLASPM
ncbi:unnamed protein product [Sphagnum tenellum]